MGLLILVPCTLAALVSAQTILWSVEEWGRPKSQGTSIGITVLHTYPTILGQSQ